VISGLIKQKNYTNIVVDSSSQGKDVLPRVAASFGSQPATDVISVIVQLLASSS